MKDPTVLSKLLLYAVLAVITLGVTVLMLTATTRNNNQPAGIAQPNAAVSADPAVAAARSILNVADLPRSKSAVVVMHDSLNAANGILHAPLFVSAAQTGDQTISVGINEKLWNALSDSDRNALFASTASAWAAVWQRNNPGRQLKDGVLLRFHTPSGNTIRVDVFRRQD